MTPRSSCPGGESTPLQGANLRLNYEINNVTDTALGNLARGKPSFCRSDRCLSYRPPGSLLESRGGSILARAEGLSRGVFHQLVQAGDGNHLILIHPVDTPNLLITGSADAPTQEEVMLSPVEVGPGVRAGPALRPPARPDEFRRGSPAMTPDH